MLCCEGYCKNWSPVLSHSRDLCHGTTKEEARRHPQACGFHCHQMIRRKDSAAEPSWRSQTKQLKRSVDRCISWCRKSILKHHAKVHLFCLEQLTRQKEETKATPTTYTNGWMSHLKPKTWAMRSSQRRGMKTKQVRQTTVATTSAWYQLTCHLSSLTFMDIK